MKTEHTLEQRQKDCKVEREFSNDMNSNTTC